MGVKLNALCHLQVLLDLGLPTGSEVKSEPVAEAEIQSDDSTIPASTTSENVHSLALQVAFIYP